MSNINRDSILLGNLCDVLKHFAGKDCDEVDLLAQRALNIIFATSHLVQPGCDLNSAPVRANMISSAVLAEISVDQKRYPWVRNTRPAEAWTGGLCEDDLDFLVNKATGDLEIAQKLIPEGLIPQGLMPEPESVHSVPQPLSGAFSGLVSIAEIEPLVFSVSAYAGTSAQANSM